MTRSSKVVTTPVIVMGMHRSGTSLLVRLLHRLGLFCGWKLHPVNHEAYFFNELNDWMLRQAGGGWDQPRVIDDVLAEPETRELIVDYLSFMMTSPRSVRYLGPRRLLKYRGVMGLGEPWGWKDPRNTFLLPLWLELFPDAKVIYVERNGIDVANSLKRRRDRTLTDARTRYYAHKWFYHFRTLRNGFSQSVRCGTLEGAFSLWEEYVDRGRAHAEVLGPGRCLGIRYEQLLSRPAPLLAEAARFAGLNPASSAIQAVISDLRTDRAEAYRHDPALAEFAECMAARLQARGYGMDSEEGGS
jgi:hypothetical protein